MEELAKHVENLVLFDVTDSTHALARKIIVGMDDESQRLGATLILTDRQDKGEGRGGRCWESPTGGLYMSWLRSGIKAETIARLPMLAAAAAHDAITRIGVSDARIKWPNDILVNGRKLAGILVFARHGDTTWVTVGLGVNLETVPDVDKTEGLPAISVPCGFTPQGLPIGVQIVGRHQDDFGVLQLAYAFEQATGFWKQRPPVVT